MTNCITTHFSFDEGKAHTRWRTTRLDNVGIRLHDRVGFTLCLAVEHFIHSEYFNGRAFTGDENGLSLEGDRWY
jgi:hypothetical protein